VNAIFQIANVLDLHPLKLSAAVSSLVRLSSKRNSAAHLADNPKLEV